MVPRLLDANLDLADFGQRRIPTSLEFLADQSVFGIHQVVAAAPARLGSGTTAVPDPTLAGCRPAFPSSAAWPVPRPQRPLGSKTRQHSPAMAVVHEVPRKEMQPGSLGERPPRHRYLTLSCGVRGSHHQFAAALAAAAAGRPTAPAPSWEPREGGKALLELSAIM